MNSNGRPPVAIWQYRLWSFNLRDMKENYFSKWNVFSKNGKFQFSNLILKCSRIKNVKIVLERLFSKGTVFIISTFYISQIWKIKYLLKKDKILKRTLRNTSVIKSLLDPVYPSLKLHYRYFHNRKGTSNYDVRF